MSAYCHADSFISTVICDIIRKKGHLPQELIDTVNEKEVTKIYNETIHFMRTLCTHLTAKFNLDSSDADPNSPYARFATKLKLKALYCATGEHLTRTDRLTIEYANTVIRSKHGIEKYPLTWNIMDGVDISKLGIASGSNETDAVTTTTQTVVTLSDDE